jgi:glutathione peroxidase
MKTRFFLLLIFVCFTASIAAQQKQSFYNLSALTIDGDSLSFASLKGKKVLVVNTASKCGFTPQYTALEALYKKYSGQNFTIIGFPSNDFLSQEPGTNEEIKEFCTKNYGVTFQMMDKIEVTGKNMHPVYQWLTSQDKNGVLDSKVKWNFQKDLIDENGVLVKVLYSSTKPDDPEIVNWIEGK